MFSKCYAFTQNFNKLAAALHETSYRVHRETERKTGIG